MDECLRLWPGHSLLTEWNIPDYLQLANFLNVNQYKCTNCSKVYEEPNQLKVHIALRCGKSYDAAVKRESSASSLSSTAGSNMTGNMTGSNITTGLNDNPHQLINQLISKHSMCNSLLLSQPYQSSLKNSSTNLGFNPFQFALPSCNLTKSQETILKQQNTTSLSSHALAGAPSGQPPETLRPDSLGSLALSGLAISNLSNNLNNSLNSNLSAFNSLGPNNGLNGLGNGLGNGLNNNLSNSLNSSLNSLSNGLNLSGMNSSLISHNISNLLNHSNSLLSLANSSNYVHNHAGLLMKRRKLEESGDLISTLSKLNNLHEKAQQPLNGNPLNGNQLNGNPLNGATGGRPKGSTAHPNGDNKGPLGKLNINLIDSDQSNDEILSDKVSSSGLINMNNHHHMPTKHRAMKLTKEPRQHTCKFCGKLYTRKYGLKIHIRTHTGHKPLKCMHCSRQFSDPSNLNKHHR